MSLHVLPGDAIVDVFRKTGIEGEIAVCREALIEGDVSGESLPEFWETRARSLATEHPDAEKNYHEDVVKEFAKLTAVQSGSEINLWFEYELFCQTNMWFCLSLLKDSTADIYRVAPVVLSDDQVWDGFGSMSPDDLKKCFENRVTMTSEDIQLGADLWAAYRRGDHNELRRLSSSESPAFPKLRDVCMAEVEKETRPREIVTEILESGKKEFNEVFLAFKHRAGVYGFGDVHVKKIWSELVV